MPLPSRPIVFCPAGARLASGMRLEQLGPELDAGTLTDLTVPEPVLATGDPVWISSPN